MPTPPPVPASQRYPVAIRDFLTYQNQPGDANHIFTSPDPNNPGNYITTDLTLDAAAVTRDLHTEILSLENTVGIRPFLVPTQPTLGQSVRWLSSNKSPGRADPHNHNNVNPTPAPSHNHTHSTTLDRNADDHTQYVRVDGTRGFNAPVTAPAATANNHLVTLTQAREAGITATQVRSIIDATIPTDYPILGPLPGRWRMTGGIYYGPSDVNGNIYVPFNAGFTRLLTFVYMKMPFPGGSLLGYHNYSYMEDQLVLLTLGVGGATIQFIEDIVVDRQATVALCWMAVGV